MFSIGHFLAFLGLGPLGARRGGAPVVLPSGPVEMTMEDVQLCKLQMEDMQQTLLPDPPTDLYG